MRRSITNTWTFGPQEDWTDRMERSYKKQRRALIARYILASVATLVIAASLVLAFYLISSQIQWLLSR
jgi:hypothetical protein